MTVHIARSRRGMRARRRIVLTGLAVAGAAVLVSAHAADIQVHDSNVDIVVDLPGPPPTALPSEPLVGGTGAGDTTTTAPAPTGPLPADPTTTAPVTTASPSTSLP